MVLESTHYDKETLVAWIEGRLDDTEQELVEHHLELCDECANLLDQIELTADQFIQQLRSAGATDSTSGNQLPETELDANLLFGTLALQSGLIDSDQFIDACMLWVARRSKPLADILLQQNWIKPSDKQNLDSLIERRADASKSRLSKNKSISDTKRIIRQSVSTIQALEEDRIIFKQIHSTGGIGQVWLAHDNVLGRDIAVKELLPEKAHSQMNRERLYREACITSQLTHPGIVPVYDFRDEPDRCYYTMKFLRGKTLSKVIAEYHALAIQDEETRVSNFITLLNHFVSICNTIAYAHSRNIVHRDLKGENIIIGDYGDVTVLDWGIAKLIPTKSLVENPPVNQTIVTTKPGVNTYQGERLGTPAFMSPEQARGNIEEIDTRTDVYGLCTVLYEIFTGRPPFQGDDIYELMNEVQTTPPAAPRTFNPHVPLELEEICLRGLSKKKTDRQQSALILCKEIQHWIAKQIEHKQIYQEREKFFELSHDLLGVMDRSSNFLQLNQAWEKLLGWDLKELIGKDHSFVVHPDDMPSSTENVAMLELGGDVLGYECKIRCKDGSYKWFSWNATQMPEDNRVYIVGRDLTERMNRDQRMADLVEAAPDAMVVVNDQGIIQLVNAQTVRLFGFKREEVVGKAIEVLVPERFRKNHPKHFQNFVKNPSTRPMGAKLQLYGLRKDGSEFPAEVSLSPVNVGSKLLISSAIRDMTQRINIEKQFAQLLEAAPDAMVVVNEAGVIQIVNTQTEQLFGYRREEVLDQPIEILMPARFRSNHPSHFKNYIKNPSARPMGAKLQLFGLRKDGSEFAAEISLSPLQTTEGLLVSSAIRDVSKRRHDAAN